MLLLPPFCCSNGSKGLTTTATFTDEGVTDWMLAASASEAADAAALCPCESWGRYSSTHVM